MKKNLKQNDYSSELLRSHATDFYFWSLFLPVEHRGAIQALLAFDTEIARIPALVSDSALGEIRYQWWRDAVISVSNAQPSGHPVVDMVGEVLRRYSLPNQPLLDLIDARVFDLYDDPMPDLNSLEGYLGETFGTLIRLVAIILSDGRDTGLASLAGHAGVVIGLQKILENNFSSRAALSKFFPHELIGEKNSGGAEESVVDLLQIKALQHLEAVVAGWNSLPEYVKPTYLLLSVSRKVLSRRNGSSNPNLIHIQRLSSLGCLITLLLSYIRRRI